MNRILSLAVVLSMANLAFGVDWAEVGDAPDGVPAHQPTLGVGPLTGITGTITRPAPASDHVDTYCIHITDVPSFLATTKIALGGSAVTAAGANVDTRLWLWTPAGAIQLANDDVNSAALGADTLASMISDPSTWAANSAGEIVAPTAAAIALVPGDYLLSISTFANDPDGAGGIDQALLGSDFDALHGPNLASGAFVGWENGVDTDAFTYRIALRGATFCDVPEPGSIALLALGALALIRRR